MPRLLWGSNPGFVRADLFSEEQFSPLSGARFLQSKTFRSGHAAHDPLPTACTFNCGAANKRVLCTRSPREP